MTEYPENIRTRSDTLNLEWALQPQFIAESPETDLEASDFKIHNVPEHQDTAVSIASADYISPMHLFPVYKLGEDGALGVPSGIIYIRLSIDKNIDQIIDPVAERGYELHHRSPIPYVGWFRSKNNDIATALINLEKLFELSELITIEPVFVMQKTSR